MKDGKLKKLNEVIEYLRIHQCSYITHTNLSSIFVQTKYGVCKSNFSNLKKGYIPSIVTAIDKTEYFINKANEVHNYKYTYNNSVYVGDKVELFITCKVHGDFEQIPNSHFRGNGCPNCAGRDRTTAQLIKEFRYVHGDKYKYLDEYVNARTKFKMECHLHGIFFQTPDAHLAGKGCIKCGHILTSINNARTCWQYSDWEKAALKSKNFDSYKVYVLKCFKDGEEFIKIGKTYTTVKYRFRSKAIPYKYTILKEYLFNTAKEASVLERKLQDSFKNYKYTPLLSFGGNKECFNISIQNLLDLEKYSNLIEAINVQY